MKINIWSLGVLILIIVNPLFAENSVATPGMVTNQGVNLHSGPKLTASVITVLNSGTLVMVLENQAQWYRVQLNDKREGWIDEDFITMQSAVIEHRRQCLTMANELTDYAKNYLGAKYQYGGSTPGGFDCSGYTMFIYAKFGYKLPHDALLQMAIGEKITRRDLDLGDLVFFSTKGATIINHVGIYLGQGDFIHASSGYGRIKVNSLEERYYDTRYRGARRVLI